jgi:hypothetical protein
MGKWKDYFQSVEDATGKKFNHGDGAFGSFGYRKTGHLRTVYDNSPELKSKYKSYDDLWNVIKSGDYNKPEVQSIDDTYEKWLQTKSNGDLIKAAKFNLSDAKVPANNDIYAKRVAKAAKLDTQPAAIITGEKVNTSPGSTVTFNPTSNNSKVEELSQMANQGVIPDRNVIEPMQKLGTVPLVAKKETPQTPEVVPVVSKVKAPPEKPSNLKKISELAMNTAPYLSNLYSATIKPPATPSPILNAPTSLQRVSMDVDRTQLESDYRDALRTSDLADVSTSVRAKLAAKAQKFNQMSKINETERNANLNISNKEREINTGIDMANRQALYNKQLQDVERENAMIAQRTANVANFSDKIIAQQARKDLQDLEVKKTEILANSDTFGNLKTYLEGIGGEKKAMAMGGKLYTAGRFMKTLKPIKTIK